MLTVKSKLRFLQKKNRNKHLHKQNECPAIVYNTNEEPSLPLTLSAHDLVHPKTKTQLYKNNTVLLSIDNKKFITVKIQEIQYHPFKPKIIHIDFIRI